MASIIYDIYLSPIKLESSGLTPQHRYAVMCDYRGGKSTPLNPAATAIPSHQHSDKGFFEINWAPKTSFQYPLQIPFTRQKVTKELQLSIKDGGLASNTNANPNNSKLAGESIINIGNYCNVLEQECVHKLVEVAFKINGKPALLSLQLAMVPQGIPPETVEPTADLVARFRGGSGITQELLASAGGKSHGKSSTGVPSTRANGGRQGPRPSGRPNTKMLTIEQVTQLIGMGALHESVFEASGGNPIEVDSDVADELIANLIRYQEAETKLAASGGKYPQQQHALSNYESQTGPIGEAMYTLRAQQNQNDKAIAVETASALKAQLDQSIAHAKALVPSNNNIYSVDVTRTFEVRQQHLGRPSAQLGEARALEEEIKELDRQMAKLEREQARRDVSNDVIYVLERKAALEEQIAILEKNNSALLGHQNNATSASDGFDRLAMLQELAATERAIELIEWRRRAKASLKQTFSTRNPDDASSAKVFAALSTTLQPPLPLTFPQMPKRPQVATPSPLPAVATAAAGMLAGGFQAATAASSHLMNKASAATNQAVNSASAAYDDFGFPIPAPTSMQAKVATHVVQRQAQQHYSDFTATAEQMVAQQRQRLPPNVSESLDNGLSMANNGRVAAMSGASTAVSAGSAALNNGRAAATAAFDDFFGGGSTTATTPSPAPTSSQPQQGLSQSQQQEDTRKSSLTMNEDLFSGPRADALKSSLGAAGTAVQKANAMGAQLAAFANEGGTTTAAGTHFSNISNPPTRSNSEEAPYVPPPAPAPSKWMAGKTMAWGDAPAPSAPSKSNTPPVSAAQSTSSAPAQQPTSQQQSLSQVPQTANYQPQWSAPHSLQNAISNAATATSKVVASVGATTASQSLDLFGAAATGGWANAHPNTLPAPTTQQPAPTGQSQQPQQQQQNQPRQTAPPAAPPQPSASTSTVARANVFMCSYEGNLFSPPIARITFDQWQSLIVQKEVGNVRVLPVSGDAVATSGAAAAGQKRNGFLVRFAGGSNGDSGPPTTRGIAATLKTLSWNVESDDFFNPVPLEINSVIMTIQNNNRVEGFGMKLSPKNVSAPAYYELEEASINELRPLCKPSGEEERALLIWPEKQLSGGGGHTLVVSATFTANGGAQIRRTIPIKF